MPARPSRRPPAVRHAGIVLLTLALMLAAPLAAQGGVRPAQGSAERGGADRGVQPPRVGASPADLVNPLMGTDSTYELSNGNTYPAIARPWGMHFWTPMTNRDGDGWTYRYRDTKLTGFKQTHQPSPWVNDYGAFALMPLTGALKVKDTERASWFSHKAEIARPYYYRAYLADYDVTAEIAPADRAASLRFTFPENATSWILLDAFDKVRKAAERPV